MSRVVTSNVIIKERKRWLFLGLPFTFTTYTLTDKLLLVKQGFLSTVEDEIRLHRVLDLTVKRNILQRLVGLGSLEVRSSDQTTPLLVIKNIKHATEFRAFLSDNVEKERRRNNMRSAEMIDSTLDHDGFAETSDGDISHFE